MCGDTLRGAALNFENGQIFHATFQDVAWCCSLLVRFVPQCHSQGIRASSIFNSQHVETLRNKVAKRTQHVALNDVAIFYIFRDSIKVLFTTHLLSALYTKRQFS